MQTQKLELKKFGMGMVDGDQLSRMEFPEGACADAQNVMWMPGGALAKRKGLDKLHSSAWKNSAIIRYYQWKSIGGSDYCFVFSCVSGATSAAIATMSTSGTEAAFTTVLITSGSWEPEITDPISVTSYSGSAIFTFWGSDFGPVAWNGAIANAVTITAAPSGAKVVCGWGNYLFLGNLTGNKSQIRWCYPGNAGVWPAANFIDLDPDDGDEITAISNFKNIIVVFKRHKMWVIHWVGGQLTFQEERISSAIGCVGSNATYDDGDILYFLGDYAAYSWAGTGEPISLSDRIQSQFNNMNITVCQIYDVDANEDNWQIWFNVAHLNSAIKNRIYVYDTRFKSWTKFNIEAPSIGVITYGANMLYAHLVDAYSTYDMKIEEAAGEQQGVFVIGTYDGYVKRYGLATDDDGVAIDAYWTSRWLDFGTPDQTKRIMRLTCFIERYGDYNLNIDLYKNWNSATIDASKTVSLSGDVDITMVERRIDFTKQIRAVQFKIGTSAISSPFILHRIIVEWLPKGRTLV